MLQQDTIRISVSVLVPRGTDVVRDGMSIEDLSNELRTVGGSMSPVTIVSGSAVEDAEAADEIARMFVGAGYHSTRVVGPAQMEQPAEHLGAVPLLRAVDTGKGWRGGWGSVDGAMSESPVVHLTREDAMTDARRREAATREPGTEADEFEETARRDPFDATIHYGCMFIDDENKWRGRWYRDEWTSEGAYTDLLYDTPGKARRAACRLRATGDES